jgi:hypothetical protein
VRSRLAVAAVTAAAVVCSACGGSSRSGATTAPRIATAPGTTTAPRTPTIAAAETPAKPNPKSKPDPGTLPQTDQLPAAGTAQFHEEMAALWSGVTRNSLQAAMPAFFPERAYPQVKAIADPRADYAARLVGEYRLDLAAAHALLGTQAQAAELIGVEVPESYAHWVDPGACYNRIGYYEVPNARVVYRQQGQVRSFGIASMISWRGVWYVVHLGAVLRPGAGGVVDDPGSGPGYSAPSSTC